MVRRIADALFWAIEASLALAVFITTYRAPLWLNGLELQGTPLEDGRRD